MDKKITNGWSLIKPVDQLPLSGVLVKDLRKLHNARNEARLARVKKIWGRTLPQIVHERNRYLGLRTYGKGAAKNQLVVRQIWTPICRKGPFKKKREQKNKHFEQALLRTTLLYYASTLNCKHALFLDLCSFSTSAASVLEC
ncbi:hypothetical protein ACOSQ4_015370 [Xanthoceras sorbifolium]